MFQGSYRCQGLADKHEIPPGLRITHEKQRLATSETDVDRLNKRQAPLNPFNCFHSIPWLIVLLWERAVTCGVLLCVVLGFRARRWIRHLIMEKYLEQFLVHLEKGFTGPSAASNTQKDPELRSRNDPNMLSRLQSAWLRSLLRWTPTSASGSARPSQASPGTRRRGLGGYTPIAMAAWTSRRSGSTGAVITVSANTTCSSSSRNTHSTPKAADVSCSAATTRAGPRSRRVCGTSPGVAVVEVAQTHHEHWLQTRGAAMATFFRSLLDTLRRTTPRSLSSTRPQVWWK